MSEEKTPEPKQEPKLVHSTTPSSWQDEVDRIFAELKRKLKKEIGK